MYSYNSSKLHTSYFWVNVNDVPRLFRSLALFEISPVHSQLAAFSSSCSTSFIVAYLLFDILLLIVLLLYVPNAPLFFRDICTLFSIARGSFLALLAVGHAGGPSVHYDARLDPGRATWYVLWPFKVAKSGK